MFGLNELCLFNKTISETKIMYCLCYFSSFIQKSALFPSLWGPAKFQLKVTWSWVTTASAGNRDGMPLPLCLTHPCAGFSQGLKTRTVHVQKTTHLAQGFKHRHILNNITGRNDLHRNIQAKLPITNLKVAQMRCLLLREQKVVFWREHFFFSYSSQLRQPEGRVFSLLSETQQLHANIRNTLCIHTHFWRSLHIRKEVRNKPLWFTSCQEHGLKHTIRNGTETSSLEKDAPLTALFSRITIKISLLQHSKTQNITILINSA